MDNSKTHLHEDAQEVSVKNKLMTSHSEEKAADQVATADGKDKTSTDQQQLDTKNLNLSKESEAGLPMANEVIEE